MNRQDKTRKQIETKSKEENGCPFLASMFQLSLITDESPPVIILHFYVVLLRPQCIDPVYEAVTQVCG